METALVPAPETSLVTTTPASAPPRLQESATVAIFGATGDLTSRKLLPALFSLWRDGYFAAPVAVVAIGRRDKDDAQFRAEVRDDIATHAGPVTDEQWQRFAAVLFYQRMDFTRPD